MQAQMMCWSFGRFWKWMLNFESPALTKKAMYILVDTWNFLFFFFFFNYCDFYGTVYIMCEWNYLWSSELL